MELEVTKYDVSEGIATIALHRPEKKNALNLQVFSELRKCLDAADENREVRAVIITGGEKVFCAGMDIEEMMTYTHDDNFSFWDYGYNVTYERIYNFRVPTIAAVSGYALAGGFDLSISTDFRVCSDTAKFAQLEVGVHLSPGIDRLWRLVGLSRAKYMGLTCDMVGAEEAYRIGLADKVVPVDQMMTAARELATKFVAKPRESLELTKRSYNMVVDMGHTAAINWETLLLTHLFDNDERKRIMSKFIKK